MGLPPITDQVVGVAVLDRSDAPERLYACCLSTDGHRQLAVIPVRPGAPLAANGEACWTYHEDGKVLHLSPSLRLVNHHPDDPPGLTRQTFHSTFSWSVRFEAVTDDTAYDRFVALNAPGDNY